MSRTFVCSSCGTYDFDGLFDLRFYNRLCCEYVFVDEGVAIPSTQMLLVDRATNARMLCPPPTGWFNPKSIYRHDGLR